MSKDKSRKHDRKGRVDTAEPRDALLACCDAAGLVGTSVAPREDSKKASRMAATAQAAAEACQAGFCAGLGTAAAIAEVLGTRDLSDMRAAAQATLVDTIDAAVREVMGGGDAR